MYEHWTANMVVVAGACTAVALCVLLHYEGLLLTSRGLQRMGGPQRIRVLSGIFSLLVLHVIEIWRSATIWLAALAGARISFQTACTDGHAWSLDSVYLSAITYTTGFGDVVPGRFDFCLAGGAHRICDDRGRHPYLS
jgi:hypothetical protein